LRKLICIIFDEKLFLHLGSAFCICPLQGLVLLEFALSVRGTHQIICPVNRCQFDINQSLVDIGMNCISPKARNKKNE
jgi:hypothetical protein